MPEPKPIYDHPCSKCGVYVTWGDARNSLGDLADHRLCPVPATPPENREEQNYG